MKLSRGTYVDGNYFSALCTDGGAVREQAYGATQDSADWKLAVVLQGKQAECGIGLELLQELKTEQEPHP
jgi:hypothetical protein